MSGVEGAVGAEAASDLVGSEAASRLLGSEAASGSAAPETVPGPTDVPVDGADTAGGAPVLSVVSGQPTDEELAALTAVVVALQGREEVDDAPSHGRSWVRRALLRLGPTPGPGSWRRSGR